MTVFGSRQRGASYSLRLAIAATLAGGSAAALAQTAVAPAASHDHVLLEPGIYAGKAAGRELVQDYGAFELWRVDASNKAELAAVKADAKAQPHAIAFEAGSFDPAAPAAVPAAFRAGKAAGPSLRVVQFFGPPAAGWVEQLAADGVLPVQPVSGNAYLVLADTAAAARVAARVGKDAHLRATAQLEPYYKLSGELADMVRNGTLPAELELTVQVVDHAGNGPTRAAVAALHRGGNTPAWGDRRGVLSARVRVAGADVEKIARHGDVFALEVFHPRQKFDEVQAQILAGNLASGNAGPSGPGYLAWLTGLGFSTNPADYPIVDVVDDGLGNGNAATGGGDTTLAGRVAYVNNCTADASGDGQGGHGHINTNIVGGADARTGFPFVDPLGFLRGQGINPYTRLAHTKIFRNAGAYDVSACGNTDDGVIKRSQDGGAVITSNSWGASVGGNYDDSSRAYDIGTRDGDLTQAGNQPMIHIFAAGNSGSGASTVGSPGTGKNVLTVGASENKRESDESGSWTDGCGIGPTGANNAMDVIGFSSRGPAEGGRAKPEVIAPGTHIQGTASTQGSYNGNSVCDQYRPGGQTVFASSSGTSHSTPAVSGVASLVYRYLQAQYGVAAPSAAMMKAYLMAHPTYLSGTGANDNLPSNSQGYGMPNLGVAFDPTTDRYVDDQSTTFSDTGQTWTWTGSVVDTGKPMRIALAWSDAPGAINDTTPQVNDLNLTVTVNGTTYLGNRFSGQWSATGGSADAANNYEAVFLPVGTSGSIGITVTAAAIAGDGVPNNGDATDQDFALVCSNCSQTPDFTLEATPGALQVCAPDTASWNVDIGSLNGYAGTVALAASNVPAGGTPGFVPGSVVAPGSAAFELTTAGVASGSYLVTVTGDDGPLSHSDTVALDLSASAPAAFVPLAPADGTVGVSTTPSLSWAAAADAVDYVVEIDDDPAFGSIDYSATVAGTSHAVATSLVPNTLHYWRVRARNGCGETLSAAFDFITENLVCQLFASTDVPKAIGPNGGTVTDSVVTVSGLDGGTIQDVDVVGMRGTHTWNSDLDVDFIRGGTTVRLFQDICGNTDDFNVTLDDAAATPVGNVCPPGSPAGTAIEASPANPLSAFNGQAANGVFTLRITDDANADGGQLQGWSLRVCALVAPSLVANDDSYAATEDTSLNVAAPGVLGNDIPASGLTAALVTAPASGSLTLNADGSFSYLGAPDDCGTPVSFVYSASDGVGSDQATATISIACANDAPTADDDAYVVNEDTVLSVAAPGVLDGDSDVDGDALTAINATQPPNGSVVLATDGSFDYTPDANYCNDGGPADTFTYQASDGTDSSAAATVSVTVNCVDDSAAVANDDATSVQEDSGANVIDVLANDVADPDDAMLAVIAVGAAGNGATAFTPTSVSYTPDADFCGEDSFGYTVNGGDTATVSVTVDCVNDAPFAVGTPPDLVVTEGDVVDVQMAAYFDDPEGDTLDFAAANLPAGLAIDPVTGRITGSITFGASTNSPYAVEVTAADPDDASATQGFSISVVSAGEPGGDVFRDGFEQD